MNNVAFKANYIAVDVSNNESQQSDNGPNTVVEREEEGNESNSEQNKEETTCNESVEMYTESVDASQIAVEGKEVRIRDGRVNIYLGISQFDPLVYSVLFKFTRARKRRRRCGKSNNLIRTDRQAGRY